MGCHGQIPKVRNHEKQILPLPFSVVAQAELGLTTGDLTLVAAPQALAVLAKLPDVFAELAPAEQPAEQVGKGW